MTSEKYCINIQYNHGTVKAEAYDASSDLKIAALSRRGQERPKAGPRRIGFGSWAKQSKTKKARLWTYTQENRPNGNDADQDGEAQRCRP